MEYNTILQGDALAKLKELPNDCIDCVITSPPYWALRDYSRCDCMKVIDKWDGITKNEMGAPSRPNRMIAKPDCHKCHGTGYDEFLKVNQLGLEPTFNEYLDKLLAIFDEIKRVLKPTGTVWVNLGDTYNGNKATKVDTSNWKPGKSLDYGLYDQDINKIAEPTIRTKSLLAIPDKFKIAMIDRGWICRNEIIWYKRNCMPSSAKDRFTVDYEKIFFFTKNERYYFETQYEPYSESTLKELNDKTENWNSKYDGQKEQGGVGLKGRIITGIKFGGNKYPNAGVASGTYSGKEWKPRVIEEYRIPTRPGKDTGNGKSGTNDDPNSGLHNSELSTKREQIVRVIDGQAYGRLKRCVWDITTRGFSGAHFATFPEALIETPIRAGCPSQVCNKCGKPREPVWEATEEYKKLLGKSWHDHGNDAEAGQMQDKKLPRPDCQQYEITGLSDCGCNAGFEGGICLDPFMGAGTVALVALKLGRRFVGIELSSEYIKMSEARIAPYLNQTKLSF